MAVRKVVLSAVLALMLNAVAPATASADWMITPWVGMNWGSSGTFTDGIGELEDEFEKRGVYGATLTWMGGGIMGFEVDFGFAPNFFESTGSNGDYDYGDNNLTTLMGNIVIGIPIGGQTGPGIRPYVTGGAGIMKSKLDDPQDLLGDVSSSDWGFNVGGGINGFFTDRFGIKGDVRYFRQIRDRDLDDDDVFDVTVGALKFWRGSVGVIFRF